MLQDRQGSETAPPRFSWTTNILRKRKSRMRIPSALFASTLILLPACGPGTETLTEAQRNAIRAEVEETLVGLTEAMNAHDPDRVLAYFRDSEEFLYLGCTDFIMGWDAFSSRVGPYYTANRNVTFEQTIVRTQVLSPTVAVVALRGSSSDAEALFWTEVLVREKDGRWRISHEHESWPDCSAPSEPHPFTSGGEMPGSAESGLPADTVLPPDSGQASDPGAGSG